MFGRKSRQKSQPLSVYERQAQERQSEYARLGLTTYEEQQRHEYRKFSLGADYRDRPSGSWKEAEDYLKRNNQSFWDWFWN
jgi:hypothetical protein